METPAIVHKVMVPPDVEGIVETVVPDGEYTINDTIVTLLLKDDSVKELTMTQKWPIRIPRPNQKRHPASRPLVTGQRILDTLFPIAKGGTAAIPGGFGTGKTMTQHAECFPPSFLPGNKTRREGRTGGDRDSREPDTDRRRLYTGQIR